MQNSIVGRSLRSKQKITLVSPYLKLSKDFRELLKVRNDKEIKTTIIFGKQELNHDELSFLMVQRSIYLKFYETLHGKCYFNDDTMIITSMNLHLYSMQNNKEFGILLKKDEDKQLFEDVLDEIDLIESNSKEFEFRSVQKDYARKQENNNNNQTNDDGYCIRCGTRIKLSPDYPYCFVHYNSWKEYKDTTYEEKNGVCHICGKPNPSSMKKPACRNCFEKYKSLFKNHKNRVFY